MADTRWMIYGANGYTGRLLAERAVAAGERPLLAGRSEEALRPLADKLGLSYRVAPLDDLEALTRALSGVSLVIHCAGPFSATSRPMVNACLRAGTHYLDVTGEIAVFEEVLARGPEAAARGVVLMPGVGFDVVPSDCLAATLAERLPGAMSLELAFYSRGPSSPGTMKTLVEGLPKGGAVRRDGRIVPVPAGQLTRSVPFPSGSRVCTSIPWGDVSTAYYSTGIPNITVYMSVPPRLIPVMQATRFVAPLLGLSPVQRLLQRQVERRVKGPDEAERAAARVELWGEVRDLAGHRASATLETPGGYDITVDAALACARGVLAGKVEGGAWTPSRAFGADFVTRLPGVTLRLEPEKR